MKKMDSQTCEPYRDANPSPLLLDAVYCCYSSISSLRQLCREMSQVLYDRIPEDDLLCQIFSCYLKLPVSHSLKIHVGKISEYIREMNAGELIVRSN